LDSIKLDLEKAKKGFFNIILPLFLITLLSISTISSLQLVKSVMAASLSGVSVIPTSNIVNERATYDFFFTTKTTGTIKTVVIDFPLGFTLDIAKLVERSGIGSGSLSAQGQSLVYTVKSPVRVSANTEIRLEIGKIIATLPSTSFTVSIRTSNMGSSGGTIDGPTDSGVFTIKSIGTNHILDNAVSSADIKDNSITGSDISSDLMIRRTLNDDNAGHAHGWNPDNTKTAYAISDSDILGTSNSEFVSVMVRSGNPVFCAAASGDAGLFGVYCDSAPGNNAQLDYIITKLPGHSVTSTVSSSSVSPSELASPTPSTSLHGTGSISTQDETASEFP
jgi:hypothetical protein